MHPEGSATGIHYEGLLCFTAVFKQIRRCFPRFQVATACCSCSPPDL